MKPYLLIFIISAITMQACFKEDERVIPYPGEVTTITDSTQVYLSYFDFESEQVIKSYRNSDWQLGFECGAGGWRIITNSGSNWFIFNTGQNQPETLPEMPAKLNGLFDTQHAWPDSTATGNWVIHSENGNEYTHHIYLLGNYVNGKFTGIVQLTFLEVSETAYRFTYKEMVSGNSDTVTVVKDPGVNFVYYSFGRHQLVNLEPDKTSYDLVFGSYYDMATLFGQTIPYQVNGALLNIWETAVVLDSSSAFSDITIGDIPGFDFTNQRDIPGFKWKDVTVDITGGGTATYAVKTNHNYIFRTAQGNYFKMRFLSFTLDGRSGFPRFEFQKLDQL